MVSWQTKAKRVGIKNDEEEVQGGSGADGPICVSNDITAHNQDETEVTDPFKQAHTDCGFSSPPPPHSKLNTGFGVWSALHATELWVKRHGIYSILRRHERQHVVIADLGIGLLMRLGTEDNLWWSQ